MLEVHDMEMIEDFVDFGELIDMFVACYSLSVVVVSLV